MTTIHGAIRSLLLGSTAVTDLVSTRIYPVQIPFGTAYPDRVNIVIISPTKTSNARNSRPYIM